MLHRIDAGVLDAGQAREASFGPKLIVIVIGNREAFISISTPLG
jgi:hypothetical protein